MKILILEKCIDVQHSLQRFFEALGHDTMIAESPVTALSLSHTFDLDILISEYFSDDENYLKLFGMIKSNKSHTKIIILTATNYTLDALQPLFDIDIKNIFQKPIDPKIICYTIDEFAKHKSVISLN